MLNPRIPKVFAREDAVLPEAALSPRSQSRQQDDRRSSDAGQEFIWDVRKRCDLLLGCPPLVV